MPDQQPPSASACAQCARPLSAHNRDVRFRLPEPVLATAEQERASGTWMSHESAEASVMMQVPEVGPFVRSLLPVQLTGGFTVTLGVGLAVHPADLQHAFRVWWEPAYTELTLDGWLANRLPLWDCLAAPAHASVEDPDHTPYVTSSPDALLSRILSQAWSHEEVLAAFS